jgi:hypothetical protein
MNPALVAFQLPLRRVLVDESMTVASIQSRVRILLGEWYIIRRLESGTITKDLV